VFVKWVVEGNVKQRGRESEFVWEGGVGGVVVVVVVTVVLCV